MAVVRVVGSINGNDIVFGRTEDDNWVASVPKGLSGEYVVDVTAYDEAGNEAYSAAMLFIIDPFSLEVKLIPLNFESILIENNKKQTELIEVSFMEVESKLVFEILPEKFYAEVNE